MAYTLANYTLFILHTDQQPFQDCNTTFSNTSGIITSPSFPSRYPYNSDCHYQIVQPKGTYINLDITYMDIETWPGTEWECQIYGGDYLEIRDGPDGNSPLIGTFCGNISFPIISTSNVLTLRWDLMDCFLILVIFSNVPFQSLQITIQFFQKWIWVWSALWNQGVQGWWK